MRAKRCCWTRLHAVEMQHSLRFNVSRDEFSFRCDHWDDCVQTQCWLQLRVDAFQLMFQISKIYYDPSQVWSELPSILPYDDLYPAWANGKFKVWFFLNDRNEIRTSELVITNQVYIPVSHMWSHQLSNEKHTVYGSSVTNLQACINRHWINIIFNYYENLK